MLSKSSKYAIRAVLFITCSSSENKKVGTMKIAETLNIPAPFLAKTLQELSKNKIISSIKGPHGGFYLTDENKERTIFEIIDCIDGQHKFEECFLGYPECNDTNPCVVHDVYAPFKANLFEKLKNKTIVQMASENEKNNDLPKDLLCH